MDTMQTVRAYHERTKHRQDAYAKGPDYLDWDQQPNPFRWFVGANLVELPLLPSPLAGISIYTNAPDFLIIGG